MPDPVILYCPRCNETKSIGLTVQFWMPFSGAREETSCDLIVHPLIRSESYESHTSDLGYGVMLFDF